MRVLIVENEIYLAQSIASRLSEVAHTCEIVTSSTEALKGDGYDVVLLSTNSGEIYKVIEKFKDSIIILLIAYISNDTVSNPIKAGADDYIQKPFMIEELIRKMNHFEEFKRLKMQNQAYYDYLKSHFNTIKIPNFDYKKLKFPILIRTNNPLYSDHFVFLMAKELGVAFKYMPLGGVINFEKIAKFDGNTILYMPNFHTLKSSEKEKLLSIVGKKRIVLSTTDLTQSVSFDTLNIATSDRGFENSEILTIDEYVKHAITCYQDIFPDTELSKRLGISRKSLWEKRRKYDISKKK